MRLHLACFKVFMKKKNETSNKSACQVSYRKVLITRKTACGFLKCGFLLYIVTGKIIEIKTKTTEATQGQISDMH